MSVFDLMKVSVEFSEGDADNNVTIDLHSADPDKERNNHVWMIGCRTASIPIDPEWRMPVGGRDRFVSRPSSCSHAWWCA
jgi:hypothetical protein